jgi:hypothetical protein
MQATDILPGQLAYVFGVSVLDAALLAWLTLRWYRRSVRRLMREGVTPTAGAPVEAAQPGVVSAAVGADGFVLSEELPAPQLHPVPRQAGLGRLVVAYGLGAASYAAVITTLKYAGESPPLPAVAWLVDWWTNLWPLVPTLVALLVLNRPLTLRLALIYFLGGAAGIAAFTLVGQAIRGSFNTAPVTNVFWAGVSLAWTAAIPLALVALTGWRRVRAVMPLALATTLVFGFGSMVFRELLIRAMNVGGFRSFFLGGAVRSSAATMQYLIFMIVSLPVGWLAWRLLILLAGAFQRKRFSDIQLVVDCWWAVVAADVTAMTLSITHGFWGIAGGAAAFLAYRLPVELVLRRIPPVAPSPRRLLLLRVFGYQARTESLFDRVAQAWRFHGPVQLIAGVDLAMRTVDPGDVLAFLDGRLSEQYIAAARDVPDRLARLDLHPDPDARFRINEVYCHDGTWRPALEMLLDTSDTVLMDLRGFSVHNAGCIFELEQLVHRLASDDIVLVCDKTTDLALLRRVLGEAWEAARRRGSTRGSGRISAMHIERSSRAELGALMRCLLRGARPAA